MLGKRQQSCYTSSLLASLVPASISLLLMFQVSSRRISFVSCFSSTPTTSSSASFTAWSRKGSSNRVVSQRFLSSPNPTTPIQQDASAASRARAPFRMPKHSFDDSLPSIDNEREINWSKFGLIEEVVSAVYDSVDGMGLEAPTPVQSTVIPAILNLKSAQSIAFAAATGSGKTLAYLLPIMQQLKTEELMLLTSSDAASSSVQLNERKHKRPRVLILAPTRELAHQISSVIKSLSHTIKLSSAIVVGGEDYGGQKKKLDKPVDIVVATPGRLVKHRHDGNVFLGSVQYVVIDEMDTMLEQGFQADIGNLVHPLLYPKDRNGKTVVGQGDVLRENAPRVVLTSATMTNAVKRLLKVPGISTKRRTPKADESVTPQIQLPSNVRVIEMPGLHRAVPRLRQVFVDVGNVDKVSLLIDVVLTGGGQGSAVSTQERKKNIISASASSDAIATRPLTIVFCNTVASCRAAEHALAEAGISSLCYHGDLNSNERAENLKHFRESGLVSSSSDSKPANVLVCTDIASRGLDVPEVDHVVMFDFPLNPIDYLHRAGRTARGMGNTNSSTTSANSSNANRPGSGRVTALVAKRDRVLALAIENAVRKGEPLDNLSSRKSDYLPGGRLGGSIKSTDGKLNKKITSKRETSSRSRLQIGKPAVKRSSNTDSSSFTSRKESSTARSSRRSGTRPDSRRDSPLSDIQDRPSRTTNSSRKSIGVKSFTKRDFPQSEAIESSRARSGGRKVFRKKSRRS